jgi:replicative DNA helicase
MSEISKKSSRDRAHESDSLNVVSRKANLDESEQDMIVLQGLLCSRMQVQKAVELGFRPEMLSSVIARRFCSSLMDLYSGSTRNDAWDSAILRAKIKTSGAWSSSVEALWEKINQISAPTMEQFATYLNFIKSKYTVRLISGIGEEIQQFSKRVTAEDRDKLEAFVSELVHRLRELQKLGVNKRINLVKHELRSIMDDFEYRQKHGAKDILGYTIKPFNVLNQTISGLRRGFLYSIAGAPRRGKTNLVLDIATYCARENKIPVLFFTWEQTKKNLTYRLLSKECYINPDTLQRKQVLGDKLQKAKLAAGLKKMAEYQDYLYIIESTKQDTVDRVRAHAYNVMQEFDTDNIVIFIDYIQKMPVGESLVNEKVRVEEISTALKGLSIELNCPVVAISSLNKEGCAIDMEDSNDRPTMYHCKGSGDIEYDLDVACILAKDWQDTTELTQQLKSKAESMGKDVHRIPKIDIVNLYMEKNRDAPEGVLSTIQYFFFIEENKFIELGYKLETDVYRFNKIENLVNTLVDRDYIKFYDIAKSPAAMANANLVSQEDKSDRLSAKIKLKY